MTRVLVFGLDGGVPHLIEGWRDRLPNFNKMMDEGASGILKSTTPPLSCPAWICFATGKNPGKVGVYDWFYMEPPNPPELSNWWIFNYKTIWHRLNEAGKKVGAIGVPLTYPPTKIDGFIVSGWPAPAGNKDYTYPKELVNEISTLVKGYEVEPQVVGPDFLRGGGRRYIKEIERHTENTFKVTEHMMAEHAWDFLVNVYISPDRIQHYFWHYMDENHPMHPRDCDPILANAVFETYRKLDSELGVSIASLDEDTYVIVMSDHGFGPYVGTFAINTWLEQRGLLRLKSGKEVKPSLLNRFLNPESTSLNRTRELLARTGAFQAGKKLLSRIPSLSGSKLNLMSNEGHVASLVDWSKTKAIGCSSANEIYLNKEILSKDEYEKVRQEIIDGLRELRHPVTGGDIIDEVYTCDQLYGNERVGPSPDIVYILDDYKYLQKLNMDSASLWHEQSHRTGFHRLEGLIMVKGPGIKAGEKINASIVDIAPTVLHIFGLPVPKDMDGRVLTEIFEDDSEPAKRPVAYQEEDEGERIKKRLKELKGKGKL